MEHLPEDIRSGKLPKNSQNVEDLFKEHDV